ncbi:MAG TPA: hypothetical protein VII58_09885 [Acidobacteriaceae bacterium]
MKRIAFVLLALMFTVPSFAQTRVCGVVKKKTVCVAGSPPPSPEAPPPMMTTEQVITALRACPNETKAWQACSAKVYATEPYHAWVAWARSTNYRDVQSSAAALTLATWSIQANQLTTAITADQKVRDEKVYADAHAVDRAKAAGGSGLDELEQMIRDAQAAGAANVAAGQALADQYAAQPQ